MILFIECLFVFLRMSSYLWSHVHTCITSQSSTYNHISCLQCEG
jgi:hypothetical protein